MIIIKIKNHIKWIDSIINIKKIQIIAQNLVHMVDLPLKIINTIEIKIN
jgi:hypothetical protein